MAVRGKPMKAVIYVRDGIALLKCFTPNLTGITEMTDYPDAAKEIYSEERKHNPNVSWDDKMQGMVELFKHLSKAQILAKIQSELKQLKK